MGAVGSNFGLNRNILSNVTVGDKMILHTDYGKIPPSAIDIEAIVISNLLCSPELVNDCIDLIKAEYFYKNSHILIIESILDIYNNGGIIDIVTITEKLRKSQNLESVGGIYELFKIANYNQNTLANKVNTYKYLAIIAEKYIRRKMLIHANLLMEMSYNDITDVFEDLEETKSFYDSLINLFQFKNDSLRIVGDIVLDEIESIASKMNNDNRLTGIPSGFYGIDLETGGWQKSDLIIVAARPGMGKTSFALALALNPAKEINANVLFFSLEMPSSQIVNRLISMESGIDSSKIRKATITDDEYMKITASLDGLCNTNLYIDDESNISILKLQSKAKKLHKEKKLHLIVVDYLQLLSGNSGNREQEISQISVGLKNLAKELNIPVIALSQLSRSVETRGGDKRPMLSDLRESGSIEQNADIVTFIYRPEYYGIIADEDGSSTDGIATIIFAKHRNGSLFDKKLKFNKKTVKFDNMDYNNYFSQTEAKSIGDNLLSDINDSSQKKLYDRAKDVFKKDSIINNEIDDIPF